MLLEIYIYILYTVVQETNRISFLNFLALFGVPFILNKKYVNSDDSAMETLPVVNKKSRQQIEDEVREKELIIDVSTIIQIHCDFSNVLHIHFLYKCI